jgi:hypothetical protein
VLQSWWNIQELAVARFYVNTNTVNLAKAGIQIVISAEGQE